MIIFYLSVQFIFFPKDSELMMHTHTHTRTSARTRTHTQNFLRNRVSLAGGDRALSNYMQMCGYQKGITATDGGTSSARLCVQNFFLQQHVLPTLGHTFRRRREVSLGIGYRSSAEQPEEPRRSGDANPLLPLQNFVEAQIFVDLRYGQI